MRSGQSPSGGVTSTALVNLADNNMLALIADGRVDAVLNEIKKR
ncbi:hypothetical protein [Neorhizobium sp. P12A]|nr:hypothetical protein [Neorhizobium sp. P12A]